MRALLNVDDYRAVAKRRLPRIVFDYIDGGAESERAVQENRRAFETVALRPRGAVRPDVIDLHVSVLGSELSMPVLLAPCGMTRMVHPDGDLAGARAAGKAGTIFVLSAMSGHPMEEVADAATGPAWYQVYYVGGRESVEAAIERAAKAGYAALAITIDTMVGSLRERDRRNGMAPLLGGLKPSTLPYAVPILAKPRWLASRLRDGRRLGHFRDGLQPRLANVIENGGRPRTRGPGLLASSLAWEDLSWVRELWSGPIVIKGVLTGDDGRRAMDEGAAAVIVSNHGGRQLDYAEATLRALPEVVRAVDGRGEVLVDGGVRRGTDVLKALSLGARAVLVGRPWVYALGAAGEQGVSAVLELLRDSMERNMALLGCRAVKELGPDYVRVSAEWK
ncbi:MAG: alpha-hydroxy-acid oxidizing protein [Acidimicrobiales bacterium]|nr:alpha-hydroxy-acid oxidizing protein [Acidimicrobiales bacterium]